MLLLPISSKIQANIHMWFYLIPTANHEEIKIDMTGPFYRWGH